MNHTSKNIITEIHDHCINIDKREIFLHSYIDNVDEEPGVDYRSAAVFMKNIMLLDSISNTPITIHMFSIGGEWESGMAMYDCIENCESYVTIMVHAQASSMSSILLQSADLRVMMPHSHFMSHFGSGGFDGHHLNFQSAAKYDRDICRTMLDIYADRMVGSPFFKEKHPNGDITKAFNIIKRKLKDGDWYLTPEETVYYGQADCVYGDTKYKAVTKKL
jgi:ATP-dependent protease ClpP protease subunit